MNVSYGSIEGKGNSSSISIFCHFYVISFIKVVVHRKRGAQLTFSFLECIGEVKPKRGTLLSLFSVWSRALRMEEVVVEFWLAIDEGAR